MASIESRCQTVKASQREAKERKNDVQPLRRTVSACVRDPESVTPSAYSE